MVLKKKLTLGLGFLFIIIFALAIFCSYYIQKLSKESDNILKDNYESIVYSKKMFLALDDMKNSVSNKLFNPNKNNKTSKYYLNLFETGKAEFEKNLKAENNNITEINEKEYVEMLNKQYVVFLNLSRQITSGHDDKAMYFDEFLPAYEKLRQTINNINDINMQAVVRKNLLTRHDSSNIIISMAIIGTICIILAFGYFWYFPFYISNSISYLSDKMNNFLKNVGIKHEIKSNDEFHIMLQSLNLLENKYIKIKKHRHKSYKQMKHG